MDNLETGEKDNEEVTVLPPNLFKDRRQQLGHVLIEGKEKDILKNIRKSENYDEEIAELARELKAKGKKIVRGEEWELEDGLLLYGGKVYVPRDDKLRSQIITLHHDSPVVGHPGKWKTLELISRNYWWPGMTRTVGSYVQSCTRCQQTKGERQLPQGKLQPNEIPSAPWEDISIDLITGLKKVKNFNAILTVVDRFTKQIHAIPTSDKLNSEGLAQLFRDNVWKHHGLPKTVISDRGPQFASNFTKELNKILGIHTKLSTAFHPQTNGQTERANQEIEQYLRMFVNQRQDNWPEWLALAEFAHNNRIQASTQTSPFNALYGRNPRMGFEPHRRSKNEAVQDFTQRMKKVQEEVASAISKAQTEMKKYADRNRKEAPKFKIGDQVLLSTANLSTTSPAKKLDDKWIGPYKITKVLPNGNAVTLDLPKDLTIHNTVNITNVKSFTTPQAHQPNCPTNPPPIVNGPQAGQFEVESILDSRVNRRRKPDDNIEFLIKWKGYDNSENTWEPAKNVQDAPEKVADYYRQYPDTPRQ